MPRLSGLHGDDSSDSRRRRRRSARPPGDAASLGAPSISNPTRVKATTLSLSADGVVGETATAVSPQPDFLLASPGATVHVRRRSSSPQRVTGADPVLRR
jgi:hypothetical protein